MNRNFARSLSLVLQHEGGFVNHKADPGGATNRGITIGTYRRYINRNGTVTDLRNITDAQVAQVYRKHYWDVVRGDELPDGVDYAVFDFAVNSGPSRAIKYLQRVVGVSQDGIIGPQTLAAVRARSASAIVNELCDLRMAFLKGLKTWATFGRGWTNRVTDVRKHALEMTRQTPQQPLPAPTPKPAPPAPSQPSSNVGTAIAVILIIAAAIAAVAFFS